jgi:hypothetical protein
LFTPIITVIVFGWNAKLAIETAALPAAWPGATNSVSVNTMSTPARNEKARRFLIVRSGVFNTCFFFTFTTLKDCGANSDDSREVRDYRVDF